MSKLTALPFFALMRCRKDHPLWPTLRQYRYAHRGYHDKPQVPENSLAAFRRAVERGWGAELDVHLMKDGALAVIHDSSLLRTAGADVDIEDLTASDLEQYRLEGTHEKIPLLDEVLDLFEGKTPLIIELKAARGNHRALAEAVCRRLDRYTGLFCIESFDPFTLQDVKNLRPDICRGQLSQDFVHDRSGLSLPKAFIAGNLLLNFLTRPDFIAYKFSHRKKGCVAVCRDIWKAQIVHWTLTTKEELLTAEREGALSIFEQFDPEA